MKKLALVGLFALAASSLFGETFTLTPQSTNAQVNTSGTYSAASVRVGLTSSLPYGCATVYPFALPKIAYGMEISSAAFSINLAALKTPFTFNADLYSLGTASSPAVSSADYYNGSYNGDTTDALGLQQHFMTPSSTLGRINASSTGNSAIAADISNYLATGLTQGSYYFLRLSPDFATQTNTVQGFNVSLTQDVSANWPSLVVTTSTPPQLGRVLFEYWTGLDSAATVNDLTSPTINPNYPNKPSGREFPQFLEIPENMDVNSGDRMRCYFYAPTTGSYTFAIAGDDNANLLFATDGNPADATVVATVPGWTTMRQWNKYLPNQQWTVSLTAGQKCYIETQHKQGTGGSNLSVGWMPPGASSIALMPATNCAPYDASAAYTAGALVSTKAQAHPRMMLTPQTVSRLVNDVTVGAAGYNANMATMYASLKTKVVNTYLPEAVINPQVGTGQPNSSYINAARELQDRVYYMSFYYLMQSKIQPTDPNLSTCLTRIYAELTSAQQWGNTDKNGNTLNPPQWGYWQFLDLPEISHAFAIGYDWCYAGWTPTQRTQLVGWISQQGLLPGVNAYTAHYNYITGSDGGNWTIVCDSGLLFSAMSVLGDETTSPQAPTLIDDIMPTFYSSNSMAEWGPDGGWPEAPCYWSFAARYLTTFLSCLETVSGTCYKYDQLTGVSSIGSFPLYYIGPTGQCFQFSDEETGGTTDMIPGEQYLGLRFNQPVYSGFENSTSNYYPTDFVWYDPRMGVNPGTVNAPISTYFRNTGLIFLRTAWNDSNALFAGIKAGYNSNVAPYGSDHEDLELGTFVFDALGVRWASDLARDSYGLPGYFDANPWDTTNRWQIYRKRTEGNNTLVLNPTLDGGQSYNGNSTLLNFASNANSQQAVIDMTSAYATTDGNPANKVSSSTGVTKAQRGWRIINGTLQVQDEVASNTALDLNWFMHTQTTITGQGTNRVTLTPATGTSRLQMVIQSPAGAVFKSMAATPLPGSPDYTAFQSSPPSDGENKNVGFTKVWIELPNTTSTTLTVALCPYISGNTPPTPPAVTPLANW